MRNRHFGRIGLTVFTMSWGSLSAQEPPEVPDSGYETEGRPGFVLHYDTDGSMSWQPLTIPGLPEGLHGKLLSESPSMGAVSMMTYYPAGWRHGSGYHSADEEVFVLEGDLTVADDEGEQELTRYSYAYFPAGMVHGPTTSRQGAVLLHWFRGAPDFLAATEHRPNARLHAQVRNWNHFDDPWYVGEPFPGYRAGGNILGAVHKLIRKDPDTGEMIWMSFNARLPATRRSAGNFGGGYEVHPSFEEYYFPEKAGDTFIGECLEGGLIQARYGDRSYWWRPGGIGHGGPTSHGDGKPGYAVSIVRTGTRLWADYFTDCSYDTRLEFTGQGFRTEEAAND